MICPHCSVRGALPRSLHTIHTALTDWCRVLHWGPCFIHYKPSKFWGKWKISQKKIGLVRLAGMFLFPKYHMFSCIGLKHFGELAKSLCLSSWQFWGILIIWSASVSELWRTIIAQQCIYEILLNMPTFRLSHPCLVWEEGFSNVSLLLSFNNNVLPHCLCPVGWEWNTYTLHFTLNPLAHNWHEELLTCWC